jgi:hypothetical protein
MLGSFVAPASRLGELAAFARRDGQPWPVTALVGPRIADELAAIDHFQHTGTGRVTSIEAKVRTPEQIRAVRDRVPRRLPIFFELPDPELVKAVSDLGGGGRVKIRTGGLSADAVPPAEHIVRFMSAAAVHDVPLKATAGLHHPLRGEHAFTCKSDSARGVMHGFLNLLLASVFVRAGVAPEELAELLEERSASVFGFEPDGITWRYHRITNQQIRRARERSLVSFGSCSFHEPVEDLRALGLL